MGSDEKEACALCRRASPRPTCLIYGCPAGSPLLTPEREKEIRERVARNILNFVDPGWAHEDRALLLAALDLARERERVLMDRIRAALGDLSTGDPIGDVETLARAFDQATAAAVEERRRRAAPAQAVEAPHAVGDRWVFGKSGPPEAVVIQVAHEPTLLLRCAADEWPPITPADLARLGWTRLPRAGGEGGA